VSIIFVTQLEFSCPFIHSGLSSPNKFQPNYENQASSSSRPGAKETKRYPIVWPKRFHTAHGLRPRPTDRSLIYAVLIFEVALNATSMFNHGNIRIPSAVDRVLRPFIVTPGMHRVHHSVIIRETNSNYGFNLPWWDRLLGTYKDQPAKAMRG
jgi:hypothetical protein